MTLVYGAVEASSCCKLKCKKQAELVNVSSYVAVIYQTQNT